MDAKAAAAISTTAEGTTRAESTGAVVTTTVVAVAAREDSACGARQKREVGCYLQRQGANVRQARVGSLRAGRRGRARINLPCTAIRSRRSCWSRRAGPHCTCSIDLHTWSRSPCLCERGHAGGRCTMSAQCPVGGGAPACGQRAGRAPHVGGGPGQASTLQSPTSRSRVLECQVLLKSTKCWYLQSCINYLLLYFPGGQILTLRRCCICCICCICYILEILEQ